MAQELGVLSVFDSGRSSESPSLPLTLLKWLLFLPRWAVLALLGSAFVITSVLADLAVLFAAKFPQDKFTWNARILDWRWRVGFYSLEEFIYRNWPGIDWGSELELHKNGKHGGRRFPAGPWNVDFLARDKKTSDLVVIHLKRGMASDTTVGQLLRHISWVKENVASEGQNVRGIIVAKEADASLEYAVRDLQFIEVRTYTVDFQLILESVKNLRPPQPVVKEAKQAVKQGV